MTSNVLACRLQWTQILRYSRKTFLQAPPAACMSSTSLATSHSKVLVSIIGPAFYQAANCPAAVADIATAELSPQDGFDIHPAATTAALTLQSVTRRRGSKGRMRPRFVASYSAGRRFASMPHGKGAASLFYAIESPHCHNMHD